jgi:hypothetical protein
MKQLIVLIALISTALLPSTAAAQEGKAVCIALPSVRILQGDAGTAASGLRDMFASYLTGPTLKSVPLESRLRSQAMEEARQKHCDQVLIVSLDQKRKGGSLFGKIAGEAASDTLWYMPGGRTATSAASRAAALAGARAISTVAANTRAKDQFSLEYGLDSADGKALLPAKTLKLTARQNGEDVLTPLVEKASEAIAAAVVK